MSVSIGISEPEEVGEVEDQRQQHYGEKAVVSQGLNEIGGMAHEMLNLSRETMSKANHPIG